MRFFQIILAISVYVSATAISASQETQKENVEKVDIGKQEFELNCTICHGLQGRGDGPYAKMLTTQVPDLATVSQRNGGTFPFQRIYDIIDGTAMISAHGTKQMPIWGQAYTPQGRGELLHVAGLSLGRSTNRSRADPSAHGIRLPLAAERDRREVTDRA